MKTILLLFCLLLITPLLAGDLILLGQSTQKWMLFFDKSEAKLWGEKNETDNDQKLILEFTYRRSLDGGKIGQEAVKELIEQDVNESLVIRWTPFISTIFPDVESGDRVKISYDPRKGIEVFLNDSFKLGQQSDKVFSRMFMGIWLSPNTSNKSMRKDLFSIK